MKVGQLKKCSSFSKRLITLAISIGYVIDALAADLVKINFRDADIRSVIESVAEITGESFVLDPRVKGSLREARLSLSNHLNYSSSPQKIGQYRWLFRVRYNCPTSQAWCLLAHGIRQHDGHH